MNKAIYLVLSRANYFDDESPDFGWELDERCLAFNSFSEAANSATKLERESQASAERHEQERYEQRLGDYSKQKSDAIALIQSGRVEDGLAILSSSLSPFRVRNVEFIRYKPFGPIILVE